MEQLKEILTKIRQGKAKANGFSLTDNQAKAIEIIANRTGKSKSLIMQQALENYVKAYIEINDTNKR